MNNMYRASKDEVMADLDILIQPVIDYIKRTWNTENLLPVNHAEYMKALEEGRDCDEFIDASRDLSDTYTGLVNSKPGYADCPLHELLSPNYVTYGQYDQGYLPLDTLIKGLIYWGMDLQKNKTKFESGKDEEDRITAKEKNELMTIALKEINQINLIAENLEPSKFEKMHERMAKLSEILSLMRATKLQNIAMMFK
jgi:hypothetical protein